MEWNRMEVTLFGSNIRRNGNESFYNNITIIPFIFIKCKINLQNYHTIYDTLWCHNNIIEIPWEFIYIFLTLANREKNQYRTTDGIKST